MPPVSLRLSRDRTDLKVADFHSLRHSFFALLEQTGATLQQAMHLAQHSDPRLTMARYGRPQLHDLGATVVRLPSLLSGDSDAEREAAALTGQRILRATETNDRNASTAMDIGCTTVAQTSVTGCGPLRAIDRMPIRRTEVRSKTKPLASQGVEDDCDGLKSPEMNSGGWDRTSDTRLMKPLL
jgi:hypothetical protein